MKKTFAFILAVIMLVGLFTGVVAAAEKTEFLYLDGSDGYGMIAFWTGKTGEEYNIKPGEQYTVTFDAVGVKDGVVMFDCVDGGVPGGSHTFTTNDWEKVSITFTNTYTYEPEYTDASDPTKVTNADKIGNGVNGRVYVVDTNSIYVDNIVITDADGATVYEWTDITAPDGAPAGSWGDGASIKELVLVDEPEDEPEDKPVLKEETKEEVLGANELAGASFDKASDANNWWFRADWNSSWKIEDGVLVAVGSGADNNGAFYNTQGEGQEYSITLKKGETYVVSVKVFRPAGVDSDSYLDINEGALASLHAEKNGEWETLTGRFVANDKAIKIRLVVNALAEGETVMFDDVEIRMVGGDPNKASSSNPATSDNMAIALVASAMVVAVAGVAVVAKKRVLSK